jgi:predicted HTH domain antitoxin
VLLDHVSFRPSGPDQRSWTAKSENQASFGENLMPEAFPQQNTKLEEATRLFDAELISLGYAAQTAGMSRSDFLKHLDQHHIPVIRISLEELLSEVDALDRDRQG